MEDLKLTPNEQRGEIRAPGEKGMRRYDRRLALVWYFYFTPPVPAQLMPFRWKALWAAIRGRDYTPPTPADLAAALDHLQANERFAESLRAVSASSLNAAEAMTALTPAISNVAFSIKEALRAQLRVRFTRVVDGWLEDINTGRAPLDVSFRFHLADRDWRMLVERLVEEALKK